MDIGNLMPSKMFPNVKMIVMLRKQGGGIILGNLLIVPLV